MSLNLGEAHASITVRLDQLEKGLAEAERKFASSGKKITGEADKIKRNLSQSFGDLGRTLTIGLTAPLAALGTAAVKAAVDMDSLKRGLRAVSGSSQETERQLVRLKEVAKLPGLGFKEAIQGSINLQAAGLNARLAERALMGFGNALATVGKGKAELDGVITALSQIQSKGKVSAEEINQLAERVPQIRQVLKDAFGTADTELLQKAKIDMNEFFNVIFSSLERLPKVTGGAKNEFENFTDSAGKALAAIGDTILPSVTRALQAITPALEGIAENFKKIPDFAKTAFGGLALGGAIIGPALLGLSKIIESVQAVKRAFDAIKTSSGVAVLSRLGLLGTGAAAAAPIAGVLSLGGIANLGEEGGMSEATRRQAQRDRLRTGQRNVDDDRRIQELTRQIGTYNQRRNIIAGYPEKDRERLAQQNRERVNELQELMGVRTQANPAQVRINAAERAAAAQRAKEAAEEAKRLAERQAEARQRHAVEMATFRDKFGGLRVQAEQDFRERIPLLGIGGASEWLKLRIAAIDKEEAEERKRLDEAHKRRLEDARRRNRDLEARTIDMMQDMAKNLSAQAESIASSARTGAKSLTKDQDDIAGIMRASEASIAQAKAAGAAAQGAWLLGWMASMQNSVNRMAEGIQSAMDGAARLQEQMDERARQKNIQRNKDEQGFMGRVMDTANRNQVFPEQKLQRIENQLRRSLGGHLGQEVAYGFVDAFADGLDKAFGRSSIGRIFVRALSRWMDKEIGNWLDSLFSKMAKGSADGQAQGGNQLMGALGAAFPALGIGLAIGGLFKGLKFADGGWVPGPIGQAQPAIVHGGEFVLSRKMVEQGGVGGGVNISVNGPINVSSDYDVDRMMDRMAWNAKRRLAVNPGTF